MVKIAFQSPFSHKDEPKKEAAEALVADKVRGGGRGWLRHRRVRACAAILWTGRGEEKEDPLQAPHTQFKMAPGI